MLTLRIQLRSNVINAMLHLLLLVHYGITFAYRMRGLSSQRKKIILRLVKKKHCPECDKQITSKNLWSHMKEVHKLTNSNTAKAEVLVYMFKCEMYSFISKRKHDLKRHVMRKHSEVDVSIQCALCDKTFQYEQSHIL